jgi:hypothetical protein
MAGVGGAGFLVPDCRVALRDEGDARLLRPICLCCVRSLGKPDKLGDCDMREDSSCQRCTRSNKSCLPVSVAQRRGVKV